MRKRTIYGVTTNRVIVISGVFKMSILSINIKTINNITLKEKKDGVGTILFGNGLTILSDLRTGGIFQKNPDTPSSLIMIKDVRKVYNILIELQNK